MTPAEASTLRRLLSMSTNPTGIAASVSAIWAAAVMIWNATNHHGVISTQVIVAALSAAAFLYTRFKVTPTADPKDGAGNPLIVPPAFTIPYATTTGGMRGSAATPGQVTTVMTGGQTPPAPQVQP